MDAHTVDLLLERGIAVIARFESRAKDSAERRSSFKDLLELVVTDYVRAVGAFNDLSKDVDVYHSLRERELLVAYIFLSSA